MVAPPAGAVGRGDGFILRIAEKSGALVLSNDSFQEFHAERPWLFEPGRLIGGKPVPGVGWIFTPRTPVRGAKSRSVTARVQAGRQAGVGRAGVRRRGRSVRVQVRVRSRPTTSKAAKSTESAAETPEPAAKTTEPAAGITKAAKAAKAGKADKAGKAGKAAKAAKAAKAGQVGQGGQEGRRRQGHRRPEAKATKAAKAGRTAKAAKADKAAKARPRSASRQDRVRHQGRQDQQGSQDRHGGDGRQDDHREGRQGSQGRGGDQAGSLAASSDAPSTARGEALNDPMTFLTFVADHPVGSTFDGTVVVVHLARRPHRRGRHALPRAAAAVGRSAAEQGPPGPDQGRDAPVHAGVAGCRPPPGRAGAARHGGLKARPSSRPHGRTRRRQRRNVTRTGATGSLGVRASRGLPAPPRPVPLRRPAWTPSSRASRPAGIGS